VERRLLGARGRIGHGEPYWYGGQFTLVSASTSCETSYRRPPERGVDGQLRARGLALLEAEADVEQLGAVERVEEELSGLEIRCGEVQVGGEAACVTGAQLTQRGAALEDDPELECALVVEGT